MSYKPLAMAAILTAASVLAATPSAGQQAAPAQPVIACTDLVANISGMPPGSPVTLTYTAADLTARCAASNGAALSVTSPALPVVITVNAGQTQTVAFTVADAQGDTASANIIVTRN